MKRTFALVAALLISSSAHTYTCDSDSFFQACEYGKNTQSIIDYVDDGGDVDATTWWQGCTGLMLAARNGHFEAVQCLVELGTDINAINNHYATALIEAAYGGHTDIVEFLIEHGANLDTQDDRGYTALMWTAYTGRYEAAKTLLESGAAFDIYDYAFYTSFDDERTYKNARTIAKERHHTKIIKLINEYATLLKNLIPAHLE